MTEGLSAGSIECQILSDGEGRYQIGDFFGSVDEQEVVPSRQTSSTRTDSPASRPAAC
jgi:hypothetical protein